VSAVGDDGQEGDAVYETRCLTAAMLEVGQTHEARLSFSREQVERYCEFSGDRNAIHRDPEAARRRFPGVRDVVVPGGLVQSTVSGILGTSFPGDGTLGLTFAPERFRKPVCPDDPVVITFEITRIRSGIVEMDIRMADAEGNQVSSAKAKVIPPDDAYRAWWEQSHR
jgi:acyl dehydratase